MMHYLYGDMQSIRNNILSTNTLTNVIANSNAGISNSLRGIDLNIEQLQSVLSDGFDLLSDEISATFYQLSELTEEVRLFRDQQFIQNEKRNSCWKVSMLL